MLLVYDLAITLTLGSTMQRKTYVAHGRLAVEEIRLDAARNQRHGTQVMTFEQLAVRLAGGFARAIDAAALRNAIQQALPVTDLGELESIKTLPGFISAAADTLHKVWRVGMDLSAGAGDHPRLKAMAQLEAAVLDRLPFAMQRPIDLSSQGLCRLSHAPTLFGTITVVGISELSPCWRSLLFELARVIPVSWNAGPRLVPKWLAGSAVEIIQSDPSSPDVQVLSAANDYHEAVEAMRWARTLIASNKAKPWEIALAAAAPSAYDDEFMALRADANFDLHFVHSIRVVSTRDGQCSAALADILVRGLSQTRLLRLSRLLNGLKSPFQQLPDGWERVLPSSVSLSTIEAWRRFLSNLEPPRWPDGIDHTNQLRVIVELLGSGTINAESIGQAFLSAGALRIWNRALLAGSTSAIDITIDGLRQQDTCEACASVAWMPASSLAASPRKYVRLLGLTSTTWPRQISEDRLLSDHIISVIELEPLPVTVADRRDFETILRTTTDQVVVSRARRDMGGRLLGKSPLLRDQPDEIYVRRNQLPRYAMSETDRLFARPADFAISAQAHSAMDCWNDWQRPELTVHDGLVQPNHPGLKVALERVQSASALSKLLRSPISFTWRYALGVKAIDNTDESLVLDARRSGILLHETLDHAVRLLQEQVSLAEADKEQIMSAIDQAAALVAAKWQAEEVIPPDVIWRRTLNDTTEVARNALLHGEPALDDQRSYTEVPFGGQKAKSDGPIPWDPVTPVEIRDTGFKLSGFIDRLDLAGDQSMARVRDYKNGKMPTKPVTLQGGDELQRCLYAFAVRALLGEDIEIDTALLYPREPETRQLDQPELVFDKLGQHLKTARASLLAGRAFIGPQNGSKFDDLVFALPANASNSYCPGKLDSVRNALGEAAHVWEEI